MGSLKGWFTVSVALIKYTDQSNLRVYFSSQLEQSLKVGRSRLQEIEAAGHVSAVRRKNLPVFKCSDGFLCTVWDPKFRKGPTHNHVESVHANQDYLPKVHLLSDNRFCQVDWNVTGVIEFPG